MTRVEVMRKAPGRFPVEWPCSPRATRARADRRLAEREWVELETRTPARELVVLDPRVRSHDWNMLNNRRRVGFSLSQLFVPGPATDVYFHPLLLHSRRAAIA